MVGMLFFTSCVVCVCFGVFLLGLWSGVSLEKVSWMDRAVAKGVAEYYLNDKNEKLWRWKK